MFIRQTRRSVQGRTYTNYLLVESVRTPKGPRQKVVCSLGDLSPRPPIVVDAGDSVAEILSK